MIEKIRNKRELGITLVALIITIIILLILAGITIGQLTGNGIFENTKTAKEVYENAQVNEQKQLNEIEGLFNIYSKSTIPTYKVGQTVTLGGETFYVIEDSDESATTVKLLAALNVITTEGATGRYTQDSSANKLAFDDDSNDYATSQIKLHVDEYKTAVEGRMGEGKIIQEARLMTKEEVEALGGNIEKLTTSGCTGTTAFVNGMNYWLGSSKENSTNIEWRVLGKRTAAIWALITCIRMICLACVQL